MWIQETSNEVRAIRLPLLPSSPALGRVGHLDPFFLFDRPEGAGSPYLQLPCRCRHSLRKNRKHTERYRARDLGQRKPIASREGRELLAPCGCCPQENTHSPAESTLRRADRLQG